MKMASLFISTDTGLRTADSVHGKGGNSQKTHGDQGDDAQPDSQSYSKMFLIKALDIVRSLIRGSILG